MDYITNSKNRKFKKQILIFFDRINFGTGILPLSGRLILLFVSILGISLFFPWLEFEYFNKETESYSAFSFYVGYIGYIILTSIFVIPFFLLSHTKKEKIRSIVPFRLSDTQIVVFIVSIILANILHLILMIRVFDQFAKTTIGIGMHLAFASSFCILFLAFLLSKETKENSIELRHFNHQDTSMISDEYAQIINKKKVKDDTEKENMVLPI